MATKNRIATRTAPTASPLSPSFEIDREVAELRAENKRLRAAAARNDKVDLILSRIAALASDIDSECRLDEEEFAPTSKRLELALFRHRNAFCHIGLLADIAAVSSGCTPVRGSAENWLLDVA